VLNPLYHAVAWLVVHIHAGLAPIFGSRSGLSWSLAIVLLTMAMRLLLFPLFVKQIKTQRSMQVLQPKIKELQQKYKGDRERLNTELMALYKEHGANPLSGCLPLLLQIPVFFALFHTLNSIQPKLRNGQYVFPKNVEGFPQHLIEEAAHAKIFGAPVAAAFNSKPDLLRFLSADPTSVKVVAVILVVLMGVTTFITQRQLMARTAASGEPSQFAQQQKILLYVLPFTFFIFGFRFPLGVLIYWLTTNVWSMAQQHVVISRMNPPGAPAAAAAGTPATPPAGPPPGARPVAPSPGTTPSAGGPAAPRRPANRNRKKSRRTRR
jgi:YidC/Oxa1 family membrane protein insertase